MLSSKYLLVLVVQVSCAIAAPAQLPPDGTSRFSWDEIEHVIAFGDSYTYIQGTAGRQNYSFIGDYLPGNFTFNPEKLLNDKIVANYSGTSAGGPNWIEFLTNGGVEPGTYTPSSCRASTSTSRIPGHRSSNQNGRQPRELWDFAFAGANYAEEFLPLHHDYTVPMVNQTRQYLSYAHPVLSPRFRKDKKDVLVAVWIGINDINDIKLPTADTTPTPTAAAGSTTLSRGGDLAYLAEKYDAINAALFEQSITPLYKEAGFTNFLFINLPPYDRTPGNVLALNPYPSKAMVDLWNRSLEKHMTAFQQRINGPQHGDTNIPSRSSSSSSSSSSPPPGPATRSRRAVSTLLYDANTLLNAILDNPLKHGFWNTLTTCPDAKNPEVVAHPWKFGCLPVERYFWFDAGHM
ncbi:uncharacterized protein B0I36DRAFT_409993 [Microdochium trichocladiopsis]|uniref:Uncharacterized protein n=1 Tax=Microdochium trichocladiopsis TaxID=1682393 RepID=A0A9P9BR17_9PEZI|nr:uncharacterized protein B0I36DRAFT_409993 [Microdochium trichocladiopsis]KAH7031518.1 hypothetical protein B0I36DRAFT_409993 [Microdochium trichocladiopsis]